MTASNINQFHLKRRRHFSDDLPSSNVNLQLKFMGDSLKSRLGCEIEAFCSNIQSLVLNQKTFATVWQQSPPQTVPRSESARATTTNESSIVPVEEKSLSVPCHRELVFEPRIEAEYENDSVQSIPETSEQLHTKLVSLTLRLINSSIERNLL